LIRNMNTRFLRKADKIILTSIFCLAIYLPFLNGITQKDKLSSSVEKRNLAKLPTFPKSLISISEYPDLFNLYYSDHFGFRESFTKAYFKLANRLSGRSSVDEVTIGRDGWLFMGSIKAGHQKYGDPMGDAININLFTQEELEQFASAAETYKQWLNGRGIEYIYVIAPNKHTIYFDKLPKYISKQNKESATDQLVNYLKKHTTVEVVDLRPILLAEKENKQVYMKSDTHWNHYGANVAQFEIMKRVKSLFPEKVSPFLLTDEQFLMANFKSGDLSTLARIEVAPEDRPQPVFDKHCTPTNLTPDALVPDKHTYFCNTGKLNAVIFGDSFYLYMLPYISRQFQRTTHLLGKISYESLTELVEQEKPDIVIEEIIERTFPFVPSSSNFNKFRE
jgi:alginate O-acetyltransferase complex protein AlgJ